MDQKLPDEELALLTTADVARLSGFATKTVLRAIRAGGLAASRVRGEYRIWPTEYRAWIDGRRVSSEALSSAAGTRPASPRASSVARLRELEAGV